jgi:hypothetical protein
MLFVAGWEESQVRFHPPFDQVIQLSAPAEILIQRLAARTCNLFACHRTNSAGCLTTSQPSNHGCAG